MSPDSRIYDLIRCCCRVLRAGGMPGSRGAAFKGRQDANMNAGERMDRHSLENYSDLSAAFLLALIIDKKRSFLSLFSSFAEAGYFLSLHQLDVSKFVTSSLRDQM